MLNDECVYDLIACVCINVSATGSDESSFVDMYNATSNSWTRNPAGLGQARTDLSAASLPSGLVIFAGGLAGA